VITLLASFGIWIYAFSRQASGDLPPPPDVLDDAGWAQQAEEVCQRALGRVEQMPGALDAVDEQDRAAQIEDTTEIFVAMIDELEGIPATTDRDAQMIGEWLADWRRLMANRQDYAERLRSDPGAVFTVSGSGGGERLDKRVTRFATTNAMPSCVTPTDV
jgi:hypothetical protein